MEGRCRVCRKRDAEELQSALHQGARRSPVKNLGERRPRTLEEVSKQVHPSSYSVIYHVRRLIYAISRMHIIGCFSFKCKITRSIFIRSFHVLICRSGTEEQYNEKERLLQQVQDLQREFRCSSKSTNAQKSRMQTREIIENISDTLEVIIEEPIMGTSLPTSISSTLLPIALPSPTSSSSSSSSILQTSASPLRSPVTSPSRTGGPIRNKMRHDTIKKSTLQFLQERHKKEVEFQEKQFRLEERRIQLEEEKFRMEKKEREARLELEIEERRQRISVSKQKQEILEILLQLIHKP